MHRETLDLRKVLHHFETKVSHFSTGTAALFGRRLQLWARDEHGLHGRGEAFEGKAGGSVEEEFGVLFARSAASGKEIATGEDAFGDFAPVRLPYGALG